MTLTPLIDPKKHFLLLNTQYISPYYEFDENGKRKKVANDFLYLVYRDLDTGEKKLEQIENPQTDTFIVKPEERGKFKTQRKYLEENRVDRFSVPYSRINAFIKNTIRESGFDQEYLPIIDKAPKEATKWRYSMFADYNICDYAMISTLLNDKEYSETGHVGKINLSRAFLDIESDVYGLSTVEMDEGRGPINAVSVVVPYDKYGVKYDHPKVYTFLLRDHTRYKDQAYFEDHLEEFIQECHGEFDSRYNTPEFIISIYDSERDLLRNLFRMLHSKSPDFILIWN